MLVSLSNLAGNARRHPAAQPGAGSGAVEAVTDTRGKRAAAMTAKVPVSWFFSFAFVLAVK